MEKKLPLPLVHNERLWARPWRWAKTAFFIVAMIASLLLVCAPPLLVVLLDLLLPPALLNNFLRAQQLQAHAPASVSFASSLLDQARAFRFGSSLVDLPAVSAARSLLILCAYTAFGGGAAYMWVAVACSVGSLCYVLAKAVAMFAGAGLQLQGNGQLVAVEAMFLMSLALAAAHLAMAYRASCRERRRLLVYRIDVEAQSVCYDGDKEWTVSVSWGFAVVVIRGVLSPREMETPMRTFLNRYRRADYTAYAFNTRPVARQPRQKPQVYHMRQARLEYEQHRVPPAACRWRIPDPGALLDRIVVLKKPDPNLWKRSPRRNCCRVLSSPRKGRNRTMTIDVGVCRDGEFARV